MAYAEQGTTNAPVPTCAPTSRRPRLLCVGVAGIDYVASLPVFPKPDNKVRSTSLVVDGGGNVANTACAISKLDPYGPEVAVATAVGDDANGTLILEGLREAGVGVPSETAQRYRGRSAFTYVISAPDLKGEHTRTCIHQAADGVLTPEFAETIPLRGKYDAAHFDARYPSAAMILARRCTEANIPYSIDVEKPREGLDELMMSASVIVCNSSYCDKVLDSDRDDSKAGAGMTDAYIASRLRRVMKMKAPNAKIAVTTLGSRGSCLIRLDDNNSTDGGDKSTEHGVLTKNAGDGTDDDAPVVTQHHGALWCPAWPECRVVDTTGAGDAFQGGFLAALWSGSSAAAAAMRGVGRECLEVTCEDDVVLAHALRIGTRVAAKKVEMLGARRGLPSAREDGFLQKEFELLLHRASRT